MLLKYDLMYIDYLVINDIKFTKLLHNTIYPIFISILLII